MLLSNRLLFVWSTLNKEKKTIMKVANITKTVNFKHFLHLSY